MNPSPNILTMSEICCQLKQRGYAASKIIRIYGEDFEILSDPFPNDEGVAVQVRSRQNVTNSRLAIACIIGPNASSRGLIRSQGRTRIGPLTGALARDRGHALS